MMDPSFFYDTQSSWVLLQDSHSCSQCINPLKAKDEHQLYAHCLSIDNFKDAVSGLNISCSDYVAILLPTEHDQLADLGTDSNLTQTPWPKTFAHITNAHIMQWLINITRSPQSNLSHFLGESIDMAQLKLMIQELRLQNSETNVLQQSPSDSPMVTLPVSDIGATWKCYVYCHIWKILTCW